MFCPECQVEHREGLRVLGLPRGAGGRTCGGIGIGSAGEQRPCLSPNAEFLDQAKAILRAEKISSLLIRRRLMPRRTTCQP
jgi:hypothetical protein